MDGLEFNHRFNQFYVNSLQSPHRVPAHSLRSPCTLLMESLHTPYRVLAHSLQSPCKLLTESLQTPYRVPAHSLQSPCTLLSNLSFIMYTSPEGVCKDSVRTL